MFYEIRFDQMKIEKTMHLSSFREPINITSAFDF